MTIMIFFIASLVSVVLHTVARVLTVKGTTFQSALSNAICFGVYCVIVRLTADASLWVSIPLTAITNFIGVYISTWFLRRWLGDRVWRITVFTEFVEDTIWIDSQCRNTGLDVHWVTDGVLEVFSHSQEESQTLKELIEVVEARYSIQEVEKLL